jgi:hypothetical protein
MNCNEVEPSLPLYIYGELSPEQRAALEAHWGSCPHCRTALDEARRVQQMLSRRSLREPSPALLAECREALREALDCEPAQPGLRGTILEWLSFLASGRRLQTSGALGLLVFGVGLGWMLRSRVPHIGNGSPSISLASLLPPDLDDMRIGGISRDPQTGEVHITLDASRRVTLEGSLDDPRIQRVLVYAMRSYDNPGIRRDTLDALRVRGNNPNVRQALLYALAHDPNLGVRLEALDAVRGLEWGPDSQTALVDVLEHDMNPGLRAAVVDELAKHPDQDVISELGRLSANDGNRYLRLKCASALRELGR